MMDLLPDTLTTRLLLVSQAVIVAAVTGLSFQWSNTYADDLELFFSNPSGTGSNNTPNVMLVLDNSVSMDDPAFPGGDSKANILRDVTRALLGTLSNLDVGIVTYNHRGASVIAPMRSLDAPALGNSFISARVRNSAQDAAVYGANNANGNFTGLQGTPNAALAPIFHTITGTISPQIVRNVNIAPTTIEIELDALLTNYITADGALIDITAPVDPAGLDIPNSTERYAPISNHFRSVTDPDVPVSTVLRFNMGDSGLSNIADIAQNGCISQAHVEFHTALEQADPNQVTDLIINLSPFEGISNTGITGPIPANTASFNDFSRDFYSSIRTEEIVDLRGTNSQIRWFAVPTNGRFTTPDLSRFLQNSLVQRAFTDTRTDNDFLYLAIDPRVELGTRTQGGSTIVQGFVDPATIGPTRQIISTGEQRPTLIIRYYPGLSCDTLTNTQGKYMLGATFTDIRVPRGSTIRDARLYLSPAADYFPFDDYEINVYVGSAGVVNDPTNIDWNAAPTFLGATGSGPTPVVWRDPQRPASRVTMSAADTSDRPWSADAEIASPNLAATISTISNDAGWCGGQALTVYVELRPVSSPPANPRMERYFHTFDSDPTKAPRLEINFEPPAVGTANSCNTYRTIVTLGDGDSAVYTNVASGDGCSVFYRQANFGDILEPNNRVGAVSFAGVPIPLNSDIISANLVLSNQRRLTDTAIDELSPREMVVRTHIPDTANDSIITRPLVWGQTLNGECRVSEYLDNQSSAPVVWDLGADPWDDPNDPVFGDLRFARRFSPNLAQQVQDVIDDPLWATEANRNLTFLLHASGAPTPSGRFRRFSTRRNNVNSPALVVNFRSDISLSQGAITHREQLINLVDGMNFNNSVTPIFSPLAEAVRYFRNEEVFYGRFRAPNATATASQITQTRVLANARTSAPETIIGNTVYPPGCSPDFPQDVICGNTTFSGGATYQTVGTTELCERNHIVILSDGLPNAYNSDFATTFESWLTGLTPNYSCNVQYQCPSGTAAVVPWINRLAAFVSSNRYSQPNNPNNDEQITVHTIGFGISDTSRQQQRAAQAILNGLAQHGRGGFYLADNANELIVALQTVFENIGVQTTALSAPTLTINAFNSLFTLDEIYISLFEPDSQDMSWVGNVKKYFLRNDCNNVTGACAVGELLDADGEPAISEETGFFREDARSVWSAVDDGIDVGSGGAGEIALDELNYPRLLFTDDGPMTPDRANLRLNNYRVEAANQMNLGGDIIDVPGATALEQIEWWRGVDILDEDNDFITSDRRWPYQDSIHTGILPVTFGLDDSDPNNREQILKLFSSTNLGEIRMINSTTGEEEWRYIPRNHLGNSGLVADNSSVSFADNPNSQRFYGIDGPLTAQIFDCNGDRNINPDQTSSGCTTADAVNRDRVFIFATERRGGNRIHALEVAPNQILTDANATGQTTPRFLWTIDAGTPGYSHLGQTWSEAIPIQINVENADGVIVNRWVVAFSAGYDSSNDVQTDQDLQTPLPISLEDNTTLRGGAIYMADLFTGDCVLHIGPTTQSACEHSTANSDLDFSIPMTPRLLSSRLQPSTPRRRGVDRIYFADLGGQVFRADLPVTRVGESDYAVVRKIADLGINTSTNPRDRRQFYVSPIIVPVRGDRTFSDSPDYNFVLLASGTRPFPRSIGVHDAAFAIRDTEAESLFAPTTVYDEIDLGDLVNITTIGSPDLADLRLSKGYYFHFDNAARLLGEKSISEGVALAGHWFFTTYSPEDFIDVNLCSSGRGVSRQYAISLLDAQSSFDQNDDGIVDIDDRSNTIAAGAVSDISTAYLEGDTVLLINSEGASRTLDTGDTNLLTSPVIGGRREW